MAKISSSHWRKMKNSYRHDVASKLAQCALTREFVTYGQLSEEFGGSPRGWGNVLGGIAIRCHEANLPLLAVLVVNAGTGQPSEDAILYEDLGLTNRDAIAMEQQRCFDYDWRATPLIASPS